MTYIHMVKLSKFLIPTFGNCKLLTLQTFLVFMNFNVHSKIVLELKIDINLMASGLKFTTRLTARAVNANFQTRIQIQNIVMKNHGPMI